MAIGFLVMMYLSCLSFQTQLFDFYLYCGFVECGLIWTTTRRASCSDCVMSRQLIF